MKVTNNSLAKQGVRFGDAVFWINPGASREGDMTTGEATAARRHAFLTVEDGAMPDALDYERDDLGKIDINKPSTDKATLLVIAAYEKADVPEGDAATKAELIKAIEAKRAAS